MAFTRKALKELGITDETLEKVMALYGNAMSDYSLKSEIESTVATQVEERVKLVGEKYNGIDIEDLKAKAALAEKLQGDLVEANYRDKVRDANINPKLLKAVVHEVSGMVDDKTDFDAALKVFVEGNPEFVNAVAAASPSASGARQIIPPTTKSDDKAYLDDKYKNNPYYKKE